jgi:hypothetical protein
MKYDIKFPKIEVGQVWEKKKNPEVTILIHRKRADWWIALAQNLDSHKMRKFDIYKYWNLRPKNKDIPLSPVISEEVLDVLT